MNAAGFDSNIIIDALNGVEPARHELLSVEIRLLSRIAWIEVMVGIAAEAEPLARNLLDLMTMIELDEPIARRATAIRREHKRLKLPDAIILATARTHECELVTRNIKDFPPGMPGIRIPYILQF